MLVKANRNPRAYLIFIPLLVVNLLWFAFKKLIPWPSSSLSMLDQIFVLLTMGISIVLLLGHKIGNRNRFITFLLAVVLMAVVGIAGVISYNGFAFSSQMIGTGIMFVVIAFVMLLAFVFAGCCCRKRYSNSRFMLWLAGWTVGVSLAFIVGYLGIALIILYIMGNVPSELNSVLLYAPVAGLVLGGSLYVIILPFMILVLRSEFFRERFYACMRLKSMQTNDDSAAEIIMPGQQDSSQSPP